MSKAREILDEEGTSVLWNVGMAVKSANRKQKTTILNEFVESSDYKRKYAIRLLSLPEIPLAKQIKRPRSRYYGEAVQEALLVAWSATNYIASKRLAPFLEELVPALERQFHLSCLRPSSSIEKDTGFTGCTLAACGIDNATPSIRDDHVTNGKILS